MFKKKAWTMYSNIANHSKFNCRHDSGDLRLMGRKWLIFLLGPLYLKGMWYIEDQFKQTSQRQMFRKDCTMSSNSNGQYALNSEYNGEDL